VDDQGAGRHDGRAALTQLQPPELRPIKRLGRDLAEAKRGEDTTAESLFGWPEWLLDM
jgi:hypothetical protein